MRHGIEKALRAFGAGIALAGLGTCTRGEHGAQSAPVGIAIAEPAAVPAVEPVAYRQLTVQEALALNTAALIVSPGPAARPFRAGHGASFERAADCLAAAVYYEAATESVQGQRAVAQVVLNRVRHPAFPKSICGVVYQGSERKTGCQFTFTCDGSLARVPVPVLWARARAIATAALEGSVEPAVGTATHYHANWVVPYWASSLTRSADIGVHIFYRWNGFWGTLAAFTGRYAMSEPEPAALIPNVETEETASADALDVAAANARIVASHNDPVPVAAPILRTLKADLESGALREDLNRQQPLAADAAGRVALAADEGRASLN